MTTDTGPDEDDVLQAFRLIEQRLVETPEHSGLRLLRERLAGELIGDADRVGTTLGPTFTLVTHAGGSVTRTDRAALVETIHRQGSAKGAAMTWLRLDDLVVERDVIAGQGVLRTLLTAALAQRQGWRDIGPADLCLTTIPLAFFIRFAGDLMASEVLHLAADASERTVLTNGSRPDPDHCLRLIDGGGVSLTAGLATEGGS
ncbi:MULTISPECIES: hypothetical protein [unclassified Pseudofrankia]|uniref:hypothetical protein n=1 Tax=unclassified Pseudofrankia TaxID=2994372 RepID=UPI0008DAD903|nr:MULTISPECIES: hypothetical protein [unclassified Pseudofrankia]MDT3443195.1 hypothetical protein [Pseudofrankia sp. BMG5.37]OHV58959.1 hypothetical protein BCD48_06060 [Pseudofrankia sp. BMG5.36]